MNILQVKEQIKNAAAAYFSRDDLGQYVLPPQSRRPIFLCGAPGIGKTAIMAQVAAELGVGLVSYAMTHHTRQSAVGLPVIREKVYGGKPYSVSEYTMSEILSTVYEYIEESGKEEGILFLDEINCVSETLMPAMLQFLQYKVFGRHRLPDGWMLVTAGNPPEYNDAARTFDVATLDRLKRIDIEPDLDAWKIYARGAGVHAAVLSYLEIKRDRFYKIETTVDGKLYVTARGWCDLSDMMKLYEKQNLTVDAALVSQYLGDKRTADDFALYCDLWRKYCDDYQVDRILRGGADAEVIKRAARAKADEKIALVGLLLDGGLVKIRQVCEREDVRQELLAPLKAVRVELENGGSDASAALLRQSDLLRGRAKGALTQKEARSARLAAAKLSEFAAGLAASGGAESFAPVKAAYDRLRAENGREAEKVGKMLENLFLFCEAAFGEDREMLIFVTELTANADAAAFIARFGCPKYYEHNRGLLFYERQKEILRKIEELDAEE